MSAVVKTPTFTLRKITQKIANYYNNFRNKEFSRTWEEMKCLIENASCARELTTI